MKFEHLPSGWKITPLAAIARQDSNGLVDGPFGSDLPASDYAPSGIPVIRGSNLSLGDVRFSDDSFVFVSSRTARRLSRSLCHAHDIIFTKKGTIGQIGIVPHAHQYSKFLLSSNQMKLSVDKSVADPVYVYCFLASQKSRDKIIRDSTQTGVPQISLMYLRTFPIQLPPLPEQRAIAAALSDVDALLATLDALIAKKRDLKQAAMQQLLTGTQRLPGFSGEWEVKRFSDIATPRKDRLDPRKAGAQEFCIELEHIEQGVGRLSGSTSTGDQSSLKSIFQAGDVLFGKLRAYLRKYWLADREGVCSTEIWALMAHRRLVIPEFLFQLVTVDQFIEAASTAYGTHMPRSDWNVVKNYEVVMPELDEQAAIAAVLSDMDAALAALEARREKTRALKQGMMQELLTGRIRLL